MRVNHFVTNINTAQVDRMVAFYRDVVGLTPAPDDEPGAFMVGSSSFVALIIEELDAISAPTREPQRVILNFLIDDVYAEHQRLKAHGVPFVREASEEPGFGVIATFTDPDGNLCQIMQMTG